jgi:hypothetical protein
MTTFSKNDDLEDKYPSICRLISHEFFLGKDLAIENLPSLNNSATLFATRNKQDDDLTSSFVMVEKPDLSPGEQKQESASGCTIL